MLVERLCLFDNGHRCCSKRVCGVRKQSGVTLGLSKYGEIGKRAQVEKCSPVLSVLFVAALGVPRLGNSDPARDDTHSRTRFRACASFGEFPKGGAA